MNGHGGRAGLSPAADPDAGDEFEEPRRRWPVVTSVLVVLILLIVGGLYIGYRATQGQYYLASDGSQVSIYRGISQKIAWISLSSVYRKTSVPTAWVPGDLALPTTPTTLSKTQGIVVTIQHLHACQLDEIALINWNAKYSKPAPKPSKKKKAPVVKIPPKPIVPASCPAQGAG